MSLLRNTGLGDASARIASTALVFRDRGRTLWPDAPTARIWPSSDTRNSGPAGTAG